MITTIATSLVSLAYLAHKKGRRNETYRAGTSPRAGRIARCLGPNLHTTAEPGGDRPTGQHGRYVEPFAELAEQGSGVADRVQQRRGLCACVRRGIAAVEWGGSRLRGTGNSSSLPDVVRSDRSGRLRRSAVEQPNVVHDGHRGRG